mgnify:CR=1 FL=1|jgi:uncharacterized protein (DUF2237 family)
MKKPPAKNVLGQPLQPCSIDPMTGWFRDGCCNTDENDRGSHTVCAEMSAKFLEFSKARGNDLSTPRPEHGFPGLKPGDQWCLCASRWGEARDADCAPKLVLASTHMAALRYASIEQLMEHALDMN